MSFFIMSPAFTPTLWERSPTLMASDIFITLFAAFGTVISVFLSSLSLEGGLTLLNFSSLSNLLRLPKGPLFSYCFFLAGFSWAVIFISFLMCICLSSGIPAGGTEVSGTTTGPVPAIWSISFNPAAVVSAAWTGTAVFSLSACRGAILPAFFPRQADKEKTAVPDLPAVGQSCQPSSLLRVLFVPLALQPLLPLLLQGLFL